MPSSPVWILHLGSQDVVIVKPTAELSVPHAALGYQLPRGVAGKGSLEFGLADSELGTTVAAFTRHAYETARIDLTLEAGLEYLFTVSGPFPVDLIGFYADGVGPDEPTEILRPDLTHESTEPTAALPRAVISAGHPPGSGNPQPSPLVPHFGTSRPSAPNPGTSRPPAPNPGTYRPSAPAPGISRPSAANPGTSKPPAPNSGTSRPPAPNPGTSRPPAPKSGTSRPSAPNPGTSRPPAPNPGTTRPPTINPGTSRSIALNQGVTRPPPSSATFRSSTTKPPSAPSGSMNKAHSNGGAQDELSPAQPAGSLKGKEVEVQSSQQRQIFRGNLRNYNWAKSG